MYTVHELTFTYITLDVVSQACPLSLHSDSRSSVGTLNIVVVIIAVVQLKKTKPEVI